MPLSKNEWVFLFQNKVRRHRMDSIYNPLPERIAFTREDNGSVSPEEQVRQLVKAEPDSYD